LCWAGAAKLDIGYDWSTILEETQQQQPQDPDQNNGTLAIPTTRVAYLQYSDREPLKVFLHTTMLLWSLE